MHHYSSMMNLLLICIYFSFSISLKSALVNACESRSTTKPIFGLGCLTNASTAVCQTAHPQCVWRCLWKKTCRYINYNWSTGWCELGLGQCESLQSTTGILVNAFGPPRLTCLNWISSQGSGGLPIKIKGYESYAARITSGDAVLIGTFYTDHPRRFWANKEGMQIGPIFETDQDIEILTVDAACPLPWMTYTAGEPLPLGVVTGGHLGDGSETYVVKINHNNEFMVFGYYNRQSAFAYYEGYGVHTTTSMDILVML